MITGGDAPRDLSSLVVRLRGSLKASGRVCRSYWLADPAGRAVGPAAAYLREVAASGRSAATQRSYGMDLLRWFRFLWAVEIPWDQATRAEARDFLCWIQLADKPSRPHWRYPGGGAPGRRGKLQAPGSPNPVTGKPSRGRGYAAATVVAGVMHRAGLAPQDDELGCGGWRSGTPRITFTSWPPWPA